MAWWNALGAGFAAGFAVSSAHSYLAPWTRGFHYAGNRQNPNLIPDFEELLRIYYAGYISKAQLQAFSRSLGINYSTGQVWEEVVARRRPIWDTSQYLAWFRQGRIDQDFFEWAMSRDGYSKQSQDLFRKNWLNLGVGDLQEALRRGMISPQYYQSGLIALGFTRQQERSALFNLHFQLPAAAETVRFGLRNLWDQNAVNRLDLDSDWTPELDQALSMQGLNWNMAPGAKQWHQHVWAASRPLPASSLGVIATQRLAPNRLFRFQPVVPNIQTFTQDDLDALLKAEGWPARFRPFVQAMSYAVPRLQFVRRSMEYAGTSNAEAEAQYLDRGFLPDDAKTMVKADARQLWEKRNRWKLGWKDRAKERMAQCVLKAYDTGVVTNNDASNNLVNLGLYANDANRALDAIDICHFTTLVKETIRVIRKAFLTGEITIQEAALRLTTAGIVPSRIQQYVQLWTVQLSTTRRHLSSQQILSLVKTGQLNQIDAAARLANLGWVVPDGLLILAQAEAAFLQRQANQLKAMTPKVPLADLKKFTKDGIITPAQLDAEMVKRHYPPAYITATLADLVKTSQPKPAKAHNGTLAMLKKWLKLKIITETDFKSGCSDLGYSGMVCQLSIDEVKAGK